MEQQLGIDLEKLDKDRVIAAYDYAIERAEESHLHLAAADIRVRRDTFIKTGIML